jgi:lipopolysaccharide/colanic/teichoic acid biosynthesis glycosyltransferase
MKRTIDFILAAAGLLVLALPVCIIYVLVRWKLGSPVFFRQTRPGLHGKPFELVKFRSMTDEVHKLDSERITPFGQFLRLTSLDEIPQLWNVLKGDMSLIGPRPLLMSYLPLYTPEQMRRHNVRPGISGWAQVNGRCAVSWEEKFRLDIWYWYARMWLAWMSTASRLPVPPLKAPRENSLSLSAREAGDTATRP